MTTIIILIGAVFYILAYFTYGKILEKNIINPKKENLTPAVKFRDNVDYMPTNKLVLFGHHFASIAGAGPIVGPAIAIVWGWGPALLWIWIGNLFIGSIHDYLSLMASVRYDGKSIQWTAGHLMGKQTKYIFEIYVYFAMILVIAAFMGVFAQLASKSPEILTTSVIFILVAIIEGILLYKTKLPFWLSSIIGVILTFSTILFSYYYPFIKISDISFTFYNQIINIKGVDLLYYLQTIYIIIAAALPVWILLQPRDYLNSYILWGGVILGSVAAIVAYKNFDWPFFTSFSAKVISNQPSPFWPTVPLVIACGALSGFHSIVASGTSSKQLDNELSGMFVGFGSMFMEGMLSTVVIASIAAFGLEIIKNLKDNIINLGLDFNKLIYDYKYFGDNGAFIINNKNLGIGGALGLFSKSYGLMLNKIGIPVKMGTIFGGLWASCFILTTLDTTNRLARYAWQEIFDPLKNISKILHKIITNRWVASIISALIGLFLILKGGNAYTALWAGFAGANQLLASIALLTATNWVKRVQKVNIGILLLVLIPSLFLWFTVFAGLIWYLLKIIPSSSPEIQVILAGFIIFMLILDILLAFNFFMSWNKKYEKNSI